SRSSMWIVPRHPCRQGSSQRSTSRGCHPAAERRGRSAGRAARHGCGRRCGRFGSRHSLIPAAGTIRSTEGTRRLQRSSRRRETPGAIRVRCGVARCAPSPALSSQLLALSLYSWACAQHDCMCVLRLRDRSFRRELVDRLWEDLRELLGQILHRQTGLLRELLQQIWTECLLYVIGRYWLIGSSPHPRLDRRTQTVLLEFVDDTLQATVLFNDAAHDRDHAGADDSTEQAIEHSHDRVLVNK